jgi:hypothetical protein
VGEPHLDATGDCGSTSVSHRTLLCAAFRRSRDTPLMPYRYRHEILEQLLLHGVRPTADTPPHMVYDFVNDLYRYELRRLRHALVTGVIPKIGYYDRVVALRRKYPLVSVKPHLWVE